MDHAPHIAKFSVRTHAFWRGREVPLSADGTPVVRTPPPDGVTLLRAVICLSIVLVHLQPGGQASFPPFLPFQHTTGWLFNHPRLGFESFFVLAGYFLAHNFRPVSRQTLSVSGFFRRRVVRLLVPYWLILTLSWAGWAVSAVEHHKTSGWLPFGFWRQMFLLPTPDINDFLAPQLWFMTPLMQFYCGWGMIFWLARKAQIGVDSREGHRATIQVMMALTAATFVASTFTDAYRGGLDFTFGTNAHYLALGCLTYWCSNGRVGVAWLLGALGMEVALGCAVNQSRPVATVVTSLLLVWSADRVCSPGPKLAWLMTVGRCSYSIYLTHLFVGWRAMALFALLLGNRTGFWGEEAADRMFGLIGCVLFGYGFYRLVEQPCARWARTIKYRYVANDSRPVARHPHSVPAAGRISPPHPRPPFADDKGNKGDREAVVPFGFS